jgi:large subunit ribosomal protein L30
MAILCFKIIPLVECGTSYRSDFSHYACVSIERSQRPTRDKNTLDSEMSTVALRQELLRTRLAITLVKSTIGRNAHQRKIVEILGLTKLHKTRLHSDGPRVWGLIDKVTHLVKVERVPATADEQRVAEARAAAPRSPSAAPLPAL